ncbi:unnamed protein product [Owenia fusiformis]|uniref:TMCC3 n=1 Tax=Owenia fusiformis TaxID=6347 RepID=A0A8S4N4W2_OWEFU|nr:unnamed protein product [Owenia fusiformis]
MDPNLSRRLSLPIAALRKKSDTNLRAGNVKRSRSPLLTKKPKSVDPSAHLQAGRARSQTSENLLNSPASGSLDGARSENDLDFAVEHSSNSTANGGPGSIDGITDELDGHHVDPQKTKAAMEHLQHKMQKTVSLIKNEQKTKEENVNEYLKLAASADKQQLTRIKAVFEKKNQKSTQTIAQYQRKLENYTKRLEDIEKYGVSDHKQTKERLRDMGQGLRDMGANIKDGLTGFSGKISAKSTPVPSPATTNTRTIVSKPREFAHLIKNKFGSADNINDIKILEESRGSNEDSHSGNERLAGERTSGTLPANFSDTERAASFKYGSDDEVASSITSGSGPSAAQSSSPRQHSQHNSSQHNLPSVQQFDMEVLLREHMREMQSNIQKSISDNVDNLRAEMQANHACFQQALEEERFRYQRQEEQMNDLTELHQHEITNLKQELTSMEEKMDYQLEERTRDIHEALENCQTRITKMELQQQQQQLISMEGIENSNARVFITKLINMVLAILVVLLVAVSTLANILGPFLTSRLRILSTVALIGCSVAVWRHWPLIIDNLNILREHFSGLFSSQ